MKQVWMLMTAVVLWGAAIAPTKWALEMIPPSTLMFLRLFVAGGLFYLYARLKAGPQAVHVQLSWLRIAMLSFTGVGGYFLVSSYGVKLTSGLHVSIIDAVLPLVSLVLAVTVLKERIGWLHGVGMAAGFGGVLVIALGGSDEGATVSLTGDLLIFASTILFAIYTVQLKRPQAEAQVPGELLTALLLLVGSLFVLPLALVETWQYGLPVITGAGIWGHLAYLIFGASMLAYFLWNKALESVSVAVSGLYLNFLPLVSILVSVVLLGEAFTVRIAVGACLVFLGVYCARRGEQVQQQANQQAQQDMQA